MRISTFSLKKLRGFLTFCGLEVEDFEKSESVKGGLKGVFVGLVVECAPSTLMPTSSASPESISERAGCFL